MAIDSEAEIIRAAVHAVQKNLRDPKTQAAWELARQRLKAFSADREFWNATKTAVGEMAARLTAAGFPLDPDKNLATQLIFICEVVEVDPSLSCPEIERKVFAWLKREELRAKLRAEVTREPKEPPLPQSVVQLRGIAQCPIVCGREVERLSEPLYVVVKALVDAGPDGLSKPDLERVKVDAVSYLRKLHQTDEWKDAIIMAGKAWARYGVRYA